MSRSRPSSMKCFFVNALDCFNNKVPHRFTYQVTKISSVTMNQKCVWNKWQECPVRLSGCKECPLEQDGRGRILERASSDSKQRAHKRWTEMSIIIHYPNISTLSNSTYMTWHMNTYDTYHIGNINIYIPHGHIMITMLLYMIIVHIPLYVSTQLSQHHHHDFEDSPSHGSENLWGQQPPTFVWSFPATTRRLFHTGHGLIYRIRRRVF